MKLFTINRITIAVITAVCFSLISCQEENSSINPTTITEDDAAYAEESTQAEASFDDVEDIGMIAADEESVESAPNGRIFPFADRDCSEQYRFNLGRIDGTPGNRVADGIRRIPWSLALILHL